MIRGVREARELLTVSCDEGQEGFIEEVPQEPEYGDLREGTGFQADEGVAWELWGAADWGSRWEVGALESGEGSGQCLPAS